MILDARVKQEIEAVLVASEDRAFVRQLRETLLRALVGFCGAALFGLGLWVGSFY